MASHGKRTPSLTALILIILPVAGCAGLSDCKYDLGQRIRTAQAWNSYNHCHDECFTCDYRDGWKAGYLDVLTGGEGCPPLVAPKRYWKPPVFFQHDPSRRDDWYCGFQDGAACAKTQPDFHYLKLWVPTASMQPDFHAHQVPDHPFHETAGVPAEQTLSGSDADRTTPSEQAAPEPAPAPSPVDAPAEGENRQDSNTQDGSDSAGEGGGGADTGNNYESNPPSTSMLPLGSPSPETNAPDSLSEELIRRNSQESHVDRLIRNVVRSPAVNAALSANQAKDLSSLNGDGGVMTAVESLAVAE